jgi:type IV pilus assembly protein PilX
MVHTMRGFNMKHHSVRRQQKGVVLIISLVILVLVTLVGLSTIRTTTMEEKMAGNSRDRDKAFQAAEAAVQTCLAMLDSNPASYTAPKHTPAASTATPLWEVETNWDSSSANTYAVDIGTDAKLAASPRCLVETLGGAGSYRVTGRAVGGSDKTIVMLQATYSKE